ncbi:MAG: HDOD domain-containing protein [Deltaproteobacteria bacterium]|nr:MAG: HDOD domain-containing protein [Deltaproteobacteria bacterium]
MDASRQLLQRLEELPPLPRNTMRLGQLVEDPTSTPLQLARVIEQDASLAARIMKLANSAYFAVSGGVDTLERAVCLLGFSTIHQIALCLQSMQILGNAGAAPPESIVTHALEVATASQLLAERLAKPMPQRFFTAGLLHDIGRLALFVLEPEKGQQWQRTAPESEQRLELERETFGIDHQTAGNMLAGRWKYPEPLAVAIGNHHAPDCGCGHSDIVLVISVADNWIRQLVQNGVPGTEWKPRADVAQAAGLPESPDEQFTTTFELRMAETSTDWT